MKCFYCNAEIHEELQCPYCRADQRIFYRILAGAEDYYNQGLRLAQIRDLSGSIEKLNMALRYNKYHIEARNLLGLVYFEIGETVPALREWVISKNLKPEDNMADHYLDEIQYGPGMLDKLDQTTKKYNQALAYCKDGNRDLARIQLRRVLNNNPRMKKAHQLLALLCIQDGEYKEARKSLTAASKIDATDPITVFYLQEVREGLKEQNEKKKKKKQPEVIDFKDGNDTVLMPRQTFLEALDSSRGGIINILIGVVIGVLACVFLVVPQVRQNANSSAASALVSANEEAASDATSIASLQSQVEQLESELAQYEGSSDQETSYEQLIAASNAISSSDLATAATALDQVNRDLLSTNGQALYDTLLVSVNEYKAQTYYEAAETAYADEDYATAIENYLQVIALSEDYDDGDALYNLADSYYNQGDTANAKTYYERFIELHEGTSRASKAQTVVDSMGDVDTDSTDSDSTDSEDTDSTDADSSENTESSDGDNTTTDAADNEE